jgi:hypothetical protein
MKFIGTKIVHAQPMTRLHYNTLRGWTVPADENPADDGYLVEYQDGGKPNVPGYAGYVSWSPKEQFEAAYRRTDGVPFGLAMEALKLGKAIARKGWNGKGMFVYLVPANAYPAQTRLAKAHFGDKPVPYNAYMALKGADGRVSTWAPSGTDAQADDWIILEVLDVVLDRDQVPVLSDTIAASQVHPSMALPSIPATSIDQAQQAKLGQLLAKATPAPTKGPSVSEERINILVASLTYETARIPGTTSTVATARLPGGFVVAIGHEATVSPENFDAELGRQYAIATATRLAREKLWEFEGYVLASQLGRTLAEAPTVSTAELERANAVKQLEADGYEPHQVRVFVEKWELDEKIEKLRAFVASPFAKRIDGAELRRLDDQLSLMSSYSSILSLRIAAFDAPLRRPDPGAAAPKPPGHNPVG